MPSATIVRPPDAAPPTGRWLIALALCSTAGCTEATPEFERRVVQPVGDQLRFGEGTRERMLLPEQPESAADATPKGIAAPAAGPPLSWSLPAGWTELAPTDFRQANFALPGDPESGAPGAECYLSLLPGLAGGLEGNINRWLGQMGADPLTPEAVAALPRRALFDGEGALIDVSGDYAGMGGGADGQADRMLGLLSCAPEGSRFLKLVGPEAVVESQREAFFALAASFVLEQPQAAPDPQADSDPGPRLGFVSPAGWQRAAERPFRDLNFTIPSPAGGPPAEAYVTLLGGDGGGAEGNLARWYGQMGQPVPDIATLERMEMLGTEALIAEASGPFAGMGDATLEDATLLGAMAFLQDRAVFVKLIGPRETVAAEAERFREFCRSLRL